MNTDDLNIGNLNPLVAEKIAPMFGELLRDRRENLHSLHVTGSAVMADYDPKLSDVNSLVLLHGMDLGFIEYLAPLGKKYGKKHVAAPLVMTADYLRQSLDSFPVEFLDFKLMHRTVYGEDVLQQLQVSPHDLRVQCEREIKTKLIQLRQGYLSSLGEKKLLAQTLTRSVTGTMALFRAIITLLGGEAPVPRAEVLASWSAATGMNADIFERLLQVKAGRVKPSEQELQGLFERYYHALEAAGTFINDHQV